MQFVFKKSEMLSTFFFVVSNFQTAKSGNQDEEIIKEKNPNKKVLWPNSVHMRHLHYKAQKDGAKNNNCTLFYS